MGTNYYFDHKNSWELSETISNLIGFIDADTVRERLFHKKHICKISAGWKPLFQVTEEYRSLDELKEFYEQNKDRYSLVDCGDEPMDFYVLLEKCKQRHELVDAKTHLSGEHSPYRQYYSMCPAGFEWTDVEFS